MPTISPCLWFDTQGEDAAALYTSVFPNSRILEVVPYSEAGRRTAGTTMVVSFELDGQPFVALNGGPEFPFGEAISFQIDCDTQADIDHYFDGLGPAAGGEEGPCGWIKDRYGVSWQIVPRRLKELIADPDPAVHVPVTAAMMQMRKLDLAALEAAAG